MFESTTRIHVVARINTYLLTIEGGDISCMGCEMYIGHQRLSIAIGFQLGGDVLHILCLTCSLGCEAYEFATSIDNTFGLCYAGRGIVGIGGGHRLDADGVASSNADIAHPGLIGMSSVIHL